jgi:hypothetical protein
VIFALEYGYFFKEDRNSAEKFKSSYTICDRSLFSFFAKKMTKTAPIEYDFRIIKSMTLDLPKAKVEGLRLHI